MKLNELFEASYKNQSVNSIIDAEIQRQYNASKPKQAADVKAKNAYSRGFRGGFGGRADDTGVGADVAEHFDRGVTHGKEARKKHVGEVPPMFTKNSYGEKKTNQAYEKVVKVAMAPYLEK